MRCLLLLGVGCVTISEADLRARLDADGDGVPVPYDCAPDDSGIHGLDGALQLGEPDGPAWVELACNDAPRASAVGGRGTPVLGASPCGDPGHPARVLAFGPASRVHVLDTRDYDGASVTLRPTDGAAFFAPAPGQTDYQVALMANRESACSPTSCTLGFPLRPPGPELPDLVDGATSLALDGGEIWYVVVSGTGGDYTLQASCTPAQAQP